MWGAAWEGNSEGDLSFQPSEGKGPVQIVPRGKSEVGNGTQKRGVDVPSLLGGRF